MQDQVPFKKPHVALVLMPRVGKLTLVGRKLLNILLETTQKDAVRQIKSGGVVDGTKFFQAPLAELAKRVDVSNDSTLHALVKARLTELRRVELDWEAPDASTGVVWQNMALLSEVKFVKEHGQTTVQWAMPPTLLEQLIDPDRFALINNAQLAHLHTYSAVALYEICFRYKDNPSQKTSIQPVEWWIDALSQSPPKIDKVTKQFKERNWPRLKDEQIETAIFNINRDSDITIELLETKTGKKITHVQFKVARKTVTSSTIRLTPEIATLAEKSGIALTNVLAYKRGGVSDDVLRIALVRMEERIGRSDLNSLESRDAYFRAVMAELSNQVGESNSVISSVVNKNEVTFNEPLVVLQTFAEERRAQVKTEFLTLSEADQHSLAIKALADLNAKGMANPTMVRSLNGGDWKKGMLLVKSVDLYAIERYGSKWNVEEKSGSSNE